jgi:hypothetical protein
MFTIFQCTEMHLSNSNGSRVFSIEQNVNFKIQPLLFVFFIYHKIGLLQVVHPLIIYQNTKFHGATLTGASFMFTSEV